MCALASAEDYKWLEKTFQLAEEALKKGEVPVGCLIVFEGKEIGRGRNNANQDKNATKHAEFRNSFRPKRHPIKVITVLGP